MNRNTQLRRTQFTPDNLRLLALAEAAGIQPAQILNQSLREYFRQTPSDSSVHEGRPDLQALKPRWVSSRDESQNR